MSATVIIDVLQKDIVDRTQLQVFNNTPAAFPLGASSVPSYLYQSLKTIWVGASATTASYQALVVHDLGTGQNSPVGSIVVVSDQLTEQVLDRTSLFADYPGGEVSPVQIFLYKPRATQTSISLMQNTALRIRYLLDNNLRGVQGLSGNLPVTSVLTDNTIDSRTPFFCFWQRYGEPISSTEATLVFKVEYQRLFTR